MKSSNTTYFPKEHKVSDYIFRNNSIIGQLDAETDSYLESCFIETPAFKILSNFDTSSPDFVKRVIVGRTGSGKTALIKKITAGSTIYNHGIIEAEQTIFEHIRNNIFISKLIDHDIDLRIFFKALWVHIILVNIIKIDHDKVNFIETMFTSSAKKQMKEKIKSYYDSYNDNFFEDDALTEMTSNFEESIEGSIKIPIVNLSGGVKLADSERISIQAATNSYVNRELLSGQKSIVKFLKEFSTDKQKNIVVSIDDLDKDWFKNTSTQYDFIAALLEAFKELLGIENVKVFISVRTDILEGVYENITIQDEKDQALILPVEWTKVEITDLLDKRISFLLKNQYSKKQYPSLKDVFDFETKGIPADEFILSRTMLRPRDAIDFVNLCFKKANGQTEITENNLIEAEEAFYNSRKRAIVKEWGKIYPLINHYIDCISMLDKQSFSSKNLNKFYNDFQSHIISSGDETIKSKILAGFLKSDGKDKFTLRELLSIWFQIGIVGIKKSESVILYSDYEKRKLDITNFSQRFYIHPLFWRK